MSGWIPPGHKDYINPEHKIEERFLNFCTVEKITDEALIDALEADEVEGDDISIDRIATEDEVRRVLEEDYIDRKD